MLCSQIVDPSIRLKSTSPNIAIRIYHVENGLYQVSKTVTHVPNRACRWT